MIELEELYQRGKIDIVSILGPEDTYYWLDKVGQDSDDNYDSEVTLHLHEKQAERLAARINQEPGLSEIITPAIVNLITATPEGGDTLEKAFCNSHLSTEMIYTGCGEGLKRVIVGQSSNTPLVRLLNKIDVKEESKERREFWVSEKVLPEYPEARQSFYVSVNSHYEPTDDRAKGIESYSARLYLGTMAKAEFSNGLPANWQLKLSLSATTTEGKRAVRGVLGEEPFNFKTYKKLHELAQTGGVKLKKLDISAAANQRFKECEMRTEIALQAKDDESPSPRIIVKEDGQGKMLISCQNDFLHVSDQPASPQCKEFIEANFGVSKNDLDNLKTGQFIAIQEQENQ